MGCRVRLRGVPVSRCARVRWSVHSSDHAYPAWRVANAHPRKLRERWRRSRFRVRKMTTIAPTPPILWTPSAARVERSTLTRFMRWLADERGVECAGYEALWRWSVDELEPFWAAIWDFFEVRATTQYERVLGSREMPGAEWFPGARINYAEHVFRDRDDADVAIRHAGEGRPLAELTWGELRRLTARIAAGLRAAGRRTRRPGRRLPAERARGDRRAARVRVARRRLVVLLAGLRRAQRRRPLRADRAEGAARRRRLPLQRPRVRPSRDGRRAAQAAADACRDACCCRTSTCTRRSTERSRGRTSSARTPTHRSRSSRSRSTTRCGSSTAPARPACRRRSSRGRAGSCSSN